MNYLKTNVIKWGFKLVTLVVLTLMLSSVVSGQGEIQRMKIEREAAREKAREEAKHKIYQYQLYLMLI